MKIILFILIISSTLPVQGQIQQPPGAEVLHRSEEVLTSVIVRDIFSPPVASRIYLYSNIAAYEALAGLQKRYQSLSKSLTQFPVLNTAAKYGKINPELAATYAFFKTAQKLVFSEKMLQDSLTPVFKCFEYLDSSIIHNSLKYSEEIADSILAWAQKDNYLNTRKLRRYNYLKEPGKWMPTPPGYMPAVEPYWSKIRTIALDSSSEFKPAVPHSFSIRPESAFYKMADDVYRVANSRTHEQTAIAMFWDCNPFYLNTRGHLNFATKKLSPGGHWISIAGIVARKKNADCITAAASYVLTSIALFDGFISCWDEKFRSNLIRPETYINSYIDEQWKPLLQTPPFPEYPSGHSVISSAAAEVLSSFWGDHFAFDDSSEINYGLPVRSFPSFRAAAAEAAISRLYGGIHYIPAIENGQKQGILVGSKVIQRIKLK